MPLDMVQAPAKLEQQLPKQMGGEWSKAFTVSMGVSDIRVPSWGPYYKGVLQFLGPFSASLIFANSPHKPTSQVIYFEKVTIQTGFSDWRRAALMSGISSWQGPAHQCL